MSIPGRVAYTAGSIKVLVDAGVVRPIRPDRLLLVLQTLARLDLPALPVGSSKDAEIGERVVVAGAGGRQHAVAARIIAKQEFAGYWEYVLDEAISSASARCRSSRRRRKDASRTST